MSKKRLTQSDVVGIVSLFLNGKKKIWIARKYHVDNSTVHYHLNNYRFVIDRLKNKPLPNQEELESWILREQQGVCDHPSFKCGVCGLYIDNARSESYVTIKALRDRVNYLEKTLRAERIPF